MPDMGAPLAFATSVYRGEGHGHDGAVAASGAQNETRSPRALRGDQGRHRGAAAASWREHGTGGSREPRLPHGPHASQIRNRERYPHSVKWASTSSSFDGIASD